MRIVNIISGKDFGGTKQAFLDYGALMTSLGHDVHYVLKPHAKALEYLQHIPSDHLHTQSYFRSTFQPVMQQSIHRLKRLLVSIRPHIIVAHKQIDLPLLKQAYPKARLIAVVHGFNARHISNADQIIAVSFAVKKFLSGHTSKPISCIPNSVQLEHFKAYQTLHNPITIGSMGVFRRKKQFETLFRACRILKSNHESFQVIIAGRGHRKYWLQCLIRLWGLHHHIKIIPWVKDKQYFFNLIDIYCITSRTESFNISLIEAMASQRCVIASDCGGPRDIILHNETGYLFPVGCAEVLASQLTDLIHHPHKITTLSAAGFKRVKACFSSHALRAQLSELLKTD